MRSASYGEAEQDALTEIVNIAMGQAGASLARALGVFVEMSVPRIQLVDIGDVVPILDKMVGGSPVWAVRQSFFSQLRGESLILFGAPGPRELADLAAGGDPELMNGEEELVLDVANLLCGACLCGVAAQLSYDLSFCPPVLVSRDTTIGRLLDWKAVRWTETLLIEVGFRIADREFSCHVLMFWPDDAIDKLCQAVTRLLCELGCA